MRRGFAALLIAVVIAAALASAVLLAPSSASTSRGSRVTPVRSPLQHTRIPAVSTTTTASVPTTTSTAVPQPPYPIADETITLVDPTRNTPARGSVPASQGRALVTVIRRPVGPTGPLPLVVFAHGWNSDPGVYETLLDTWAAAGYLVAAPTFPDSADTLPGTPVSDFADQARDVSFVISSLLSGRAGPVDASRIAVAGHSDGGSDVDVLALDPNFTDTRIRAYLSMSGDIQVGLPGPWDNPTPGAFEAIVGTNDQYDELPKTTQAFDTAAMQKVLLTVAGGDHLSMYLGSSALSVALRQETLRFLAAAFGTPSSSSGELAAASEPTGDPAISVTAG